MTQIASGLSAPSPTAISGSRPGSVPPGGGLRRNPRVPSYPDKIFSLADYSLPKNINDLFKLCAYFFTTNSLVHPVIYKMSEYPVTKFKYHSPADDEQAVSRTRRLVEKEWKGRHHLIEVGIYYHAFGNCIPLVTYVGQRYLKCPRCSRYYQLNRLPFRWVDFTPHAECPVPTCKYNGAFDSFRVYPRNEKYVRPVILDPRYVDIKYNEITGTKKYLYRIPPTMRSAIQRGDPYVIDTVPPVFIDAVRKGMKVEIDDQCLFHFMRPGLSASNQGWGMPSIAPVMKDLHYPQTMRRAQEAISLQHIVPLMILFPSNKEGVDRIQTHNLGNFTRQVETQVRRWMSDPNYTMIMPTPIGVENIGGDARALLITPEIESTQHTIINGMLSPRELVQGGLSFSGSSISLRILENHFMNYREDVDLYMEFAMDRTQSYLEWPSVRVELEDFKMADDVQKLHLEAQAATEGMLSRTRYLEDLGIDPKEDHRIRMEELEEERVYQESRALVGANAEGAAGAMAARWQVRAQKAMTGEEEQNLEGTEGIPVTDPDGMIDIVAEMILASPEQVQAQAISRLQEMPSLAQAVQRRIAAMLGNPEAKAEEDARQRGLSMEESAMGGEAPSNGTTVGYTGGSNGKGSAGVAAAGGGAGGGVGPPKPQPQQKPPQRKVGGV